MSSTSTQGIVSGILHQEQDINSCSTCSDMVRYYSNSRWWGWTNHCLDDVCDGLDIGTDGGQLRPLPAMLSYPEKLQIATKMRSLNWTAHGCGLLIWGSQVPPTTILYMLWLKRPSSPLCKSMAWSFFWIHLVHPFPCYLEFNITRPMGEAIWLKSKSSPTKTVKKTVYSIKASSHSIMWTNNLEKGNLSSSWLIFRTFCWPKGAPLTWFPTEHESKVAKKHPKNQIEPKTGQSSQLWSFFFKIPERLVDFLVSICQPGNSTLILCGTTCASVFDQTGGLMEVRDGSRSTKEVMIGDFVYLFLQTSVHLDPMIPKPQGRIIAIVLPWSHELLKPQRWKRSFSFSSIFFFRGQHILGFSENRISIIWSHFWEKSVGSCRRVKGYVTWWNSWLRRPEAGEFLWDFHVPKQSVEIGPPEAIGVIHSLKRTANIAPWK